MSKLPAELIDRVIDFLHLDRRALAACSLVCKSWIPASRYHLFQELTITSANASLFEPSGPTTTSGVGQPSKSTIGLPRGIEIYVRSISCIMDGCGTEWLTESVMRSIAALPSLSEFSTIGYPFPNPPLELLKNLKKLSIGGCDNSAIPGMAVAIANSPELTHLYCSSMAYREVPQLQDLFANLSPDSPPLKIQHLGVTNIDLSIDASILPHLYSLTSLEWVPYSDYPASFPTIWQTLTSEGIQLSRLKTNVVNDGLLSFLSSYKGLSDLRLVRVAVNDDDDSGHLTRRFFEAVLPQHANSLKVLRIEAVYEGNWCFGINNFVSITNCIELEELAVSLYWPTRHDYSDNSPVHLLLNTASQLPRLRLVEIFAAITPRLRNSRCGNPIISYKRIVYMAILNAVNGFENLGKDGDISGLPGYELRVRDKRMLVPRISAL